MLPGYASVTNHRLVQECMPEYWSGYIRLSVSSGGHIAWGEYIYTIPVSRVITLVYFHWSSGRLYFSVV